MPYLRTKTFPTITGAVGTIQPFTPQIIIPANRIAISDVFRLAFGVSSSGNIVQGITFFPTFTNAGNAFTTTGITLAAGVLQVLPANNSVDPWKAGIVLTFYIDSHGTMQFYLEGSASGITVPQPITSVGLPLDRTKPLLIEVQAQFAGVQADQNLKSEYFAVDWNQFNAIN